MTLTIPQLPLYWRFESALAPHPNIPETYDFVFDFEPSLNLLVEKKSEELLSILSQVYDAESNIGYLQEGTNLGATYGREYIKFLIESLPKPDKQTIADVGCGGCLLLEELRDLGFSVVGVDPSPIAINAARTKSIDLIPSMLDENSFPDSSIDYITQMDVLEHAYDPVELLSFERKALNENGFIFINVPNCEKSISLGDISMAIHQHVNMYTRYSLAKVVEAAGLFIHTMTISKYGSAIYCIATKNRSCSRLSAEDFKDFQADQLDFENLATQRVQKFQSLYEPFQDQNNGFYIFQRLLPYLCASGFSLHGRFFDNNTLWHNKFLDGVPGKIENYQDFLDNPTENLFIFSHSFSDEIIDSLSELGLPTRLFSQNTFFHD